MPVPQTNKARERRLGEEGRGPKSFLRPTMKVRRWEINKKAEHRDPHRHKFFRPGQAATLETGRGSGSPPGPPHSHTDSEWESRSWSLSTSFQTQERTQINAQLWRLFALRKTMFLTGAGAIRRQRVAVQTVALVTPIAVHAAVLTGTRFQATLVQI